MCGCITLAILFILFREGGLQALKSIIAECVASFSLVSVKPQAPGINVQDMCDKFDEFKIKGDF